jgi:hypothetical protein
MLKVLALIFFTLSNGFDKKYFVFYPTEMSTVSTLNVKNLASSLAQAASDNLSVGDGGVFL